MYKDLILKKHGRPSYLPPQIRWFPLRYSLFYIEKKYQEYLKYINDFNIKDELTNLLTVDTSTNDEINYNIGDLLYITFLNKDLNDNNLKIKYTLNTNEYDKILDLLTSDYILSNNYLIITVNSTNIESKKIIEQLYNDILIFSKFIEEKYNEIILLKLIGSKNVNLELTLAEHIYNDGKKYSDNELYYPYYKLSDNRIPDLLYFFQILCFYLHPKLKEYWIYNFTKIEKQLVLFNVYHNNKHISFNNYIYAQFKNLYEYLLKHKKDIENNKDIIDFINTYKFVTYINEYKIEDATIINIERIINYFIRYCNSIMSDFLLIYNETTENFIKELYVE